MEILQEIDAATDKTLDSRVRYTNLINQISIQSTFKINVVNCSSFFLFIRSTQNPYVMTN